MEPVFMSPKPDAGKVQAQSLREYQKPVLIRGPVLTRVTAMSGIAVVSGGIPADCWVARAAFGDADIRWMIFREWLFTDAPAWFRNLYIRYGEAVGSWLRGYPDVQAVVRSLMMPAIRRRLQSGGGQ